MCSYIFFHLIHCSLIIWRNSISLFYSVYLFLYIKYFFFSFIPFVILRSVLFFFFFFLIRQVNHHTTIWNTRIPMSSCKILIQYNCIWREWFFAGWINIFRCFYFWCPRNTPERCRWAHLDFTWVNHSTSYMFLCVCLCVISLLIIYNVIIYTLWNFSIFHQIHLTAYSLLNIRISGYSV